ncbi:MAG TPA: TolC family protein [Bryobacteraceae bacterium]
MNKYLLLALGACLSGSAATAAPVLDGWEAQDMQHNMPGMQMPAPQHEHSEAPKQGPQHPAGETKPQSTVPDLLQEAAGRKALRLEDFEQMAASNPTLKQASDLIRRTAGQAKQAGLYPNPSIGYEGDQIRGGEYHGGEQGAFVQQTIVLGGKLRLRRQALQAQQREDELGAAEQGSRVTSEIAQSFYAALAAQEAVRVRHDLLRLAQDAVTTAHQLANVGQADAPDVLQSEVEEEQAQIDYVTAQRSYIQEFRSLAAVAGQTGLPLARLEGKLEEVPPIDPQAIVDTILRDSPTVKRAEQAAVAAQAQLRSARRESVPDITVRAGLQQSYEAINQTGRPVGVQGFGTATIALPIFNRNQGNVQAAEAELERAQAEVSRVRLSLRQVAEPLVQRYLASQAQATRYKQEMIPRASRAYRLYLDRYRAMAAAYPQVIVSQRTLFQLQISYIQVLQQLWTSAVLLQNFNLTGALEAPIASPDPVGAINLPTGSGAQ